MTHSELVQRAARWLRNQGCGVVLAEMHSYAGEIPDAIGWKAGRFSILIECKVSRSDFYADAHKVSRRRWSGGMGHHRYYLAPAGVLTPELVRAKRPRWGLLEVHPKTVRVRLRPESNGTATAWRELPLLLSYVRRVQQYGLGLDEVQRVVAQAAGAQR